MARVMGDMIALRTAAIDSAVRGRDRQWRDAARHPRRRVRRARVADARAGRSESLRGRSSGHARGQACAPRRAASGDRQSSASSRSTSSASRSASRWIAPDMIASSPTCWIWEGVVMYLTREAMRATLAGIGGQERARLDADRELPHGSSPLLRAADVPVDRRTANQRVDAR